MLLNHILKIEEAGRRKVAVRLDDWDECSINVEQSIFILLQRAEVVKMSIFEYDEEREIELIRKDEREIGERIGIEKERQNTQKERENAIQSIISVYKETKSSPEQAVQKLMQLYQLNEEQAKEKVAFYWKRQPV